MISDPPTIDMVNQPPHYTAHPSVECIQVTEHLGFCLGNAMKYIWRADEKGNALEDLAKAKWYLEREIARRTPEGGSSSIEERRDSCLWGEDSDGVVQTQCGESVIFENDWRQFSRFCQSCGGVIIQSGHPSS